MNHKKVSPGKAQLTGSEDDNIKVAVVGEVVKCEKEDLPGVHNGRPLHGAGQVQEENHLKGGRTGHLKLRVEGQHTGLQNTHITRDQELYLHQSVPRGHILGANLKGNLHPMHQILDFQIEFPYIYHT